MKQRLSKEVSQRVWVTRYIMIIGIVIVHIPPDVPLNQLSGSVFDFAKAFFAQAAFKATVPVLMAISGFFVFYTEVYKYPLKLLKKRSDTVLLPLLLWNIPFAIFIFIVQKYDLISHKFTYQLYPVEALTWLNAIAGVTQSPVNVSLNFLRDLFVVSLLSPLFWLLLKRIPYIGIVVVWIIYYFNLDGPLVIRNSMLLSFYIGALAACQNWNLTSLDRFAVPLFACFVIYCIVIVYFRMENLELFRLSAVFMLWPAISLLSDTKIGDWLYQHSNASFLTFLSHGPIILVTWLIFKSLPIDVPYIVYWIICPIFTVLFCIFLHNQFYKRMPVVASVMLGGR